MPAHLAQLNFARLRQPLDHPDSAGFVDGLDAVNAAGDAAPGFVWRLQDVGGDATSIQVFDDPLTIVNLTVWESIDALRAFAYRGLHREFFQRRAEWFTRDGSGTAMWWVPIGTMPDEWEARRRYEFIEAFGPSPYAFWFGQRQPVVTIERAAVDSTDAQHLIDALDAELSGMYPEPGSNHFRLDRHEVDGDRGAFLIARLDDEPVACGAFRRLDGDGGLAGVAEIKRMYVAPAARGLKLGAAMLWELEARAAALGVGEMRLETGIRQDAALALYTRFGYEHIAPWGEYAASESTSRCMARALTSARPPRVVGCDVHAGDQ